MNKLFFKISSGVFGGTILGVLSFFFSIGYSEKHGECFAFANFLFNLVGYEYEACNSLSALSGLPVVIILSIILGSFLGVFLMGRIKTIHYLRYSVVLISAIFFLPFLYFTLKDFPEFLKSGGVFFTFFIVSVFILFSVVPSTILVLIANWLKKIR